MKSLNTTPNTPKRIGRRPLIIATSKGSIQESVKKWGGMTVSEMEKLTADNEEEYKRGMLCKPNLWKRTVVALKGFVKFQGGVVPSSEEELLSYPLTLVDLDKYISHLILKETSFKTLTIIDGHYYNLVTLYRHRKGYHKNVPYDPLDILIRDKLMELARQHKRGRVS